jgi:putative IMPACT (imprinted ancient) family translation regulator
MDSYRIPTGNGASEYVEKRSRFLGLVQPVSARDHRRLQKAVPRRAAQLLVLPAA